jgi:hypothetical protein
MVDSETGGVRLLVFCRNCGGLAANLVLPDEGALRKVAPSAEALMDWPGRGAYVPPGQPLFVITRPIQDRTDPPALGAHGFCWQPPDPSIPMIYHRCSPHLVVTDTPASVHLPVRFTHPESPEPVLAGHHG